MHLAIDAQIWQKSLPYKAKMDNFLLSLCFLIKQIQTRINLKSVLDICFKCIKISCKMHKMTIFHSLFETISIKQFQQHHSPLCEKSEGTMFGTCNTYKVNTKSIIRYNIMVLCKTVPVEYNTEWHITSTALPDPRGLLGAKFALFDDPQW